MALFLLINSDQESYVGHSKKLLTEPFDWNHTLDGLSFKAIDQTSTVWFERTFEEEEVHQVVRKNNRDKAMGSDGLTMTFFSNLLEVMKIFHKFFTFGKFEKIFNSTFIALIPKKLV